MKQFTYSELLPVGGSEPIKLVFTESVVQFRQQPDVWTDEKLLLELTHEQFKKAVSIVGRAHIAQLVATGDPAKPSTTENER